MNFKHFSFSFFLLKINNNNYYIISNSMIYTILFHHDFLIFDFFQICPTPYNHKQNVQSGLNNFFHPFICLMLYNHTQNVLSVSLNHFHTSFHMSNAI